MAPTQRIVVVGGGYVGMYTSLRLQKKLRKGEAEITVIDPQSHMTYQPFLPEAAAARSSRVTWSSPCARCCGNATT